MTGVLCYKDVFLLLSNVRIFIIFHDEHFKFILLLYFVAEKKKKNAESK